MLPLVITNKTYQKRRHWSGRTGAKEVGADSVISPRSWTGCPYPLPWGCQGLPSQCPLFMRSLSCFHFLRYFSFISWLNSWAHRAGTILPLRFGIVSDNSWQKHHHPHFTGGEAQMPKYWTSSRSLLLRGLHQCKPWGLITWPWPEVFPPIYTHTFYTHTL